MIFGPIDQFGCFSASLGRAAAIASRVQSRNGPPEAVRMIRSTSVDRPAVERLEDGVVLGIDRQDRDAGPARLAP